MRKLVVTVAISSLCVLDAATAALAQPEKSLDKCQQTAGKVLGKYAAEVHKTVATCLNAISKERVKNATGSSVAAAPKCVSAFRKIMNNEDSAKELGEKALTKVLASCDPSFNGGLVHVEDDVVDADNSGTFSALGDRLHAERLGMSCAISEGISNSGTEGRLGNVVEWAVCQLAAADRGALRQVHLAYPEGDFWLRDVQPTIDAMATLGDLKPQDALLVLDYVRRWVDQGNGTVYDRVTELTWEQKTDGSIHDKDNTYTWTAGTNNPDGTAFTTFLNTLNGGATGVGNCTSGNGITQSGGFAGHCDWRLPTIAELRTILLEPSPCSTSPCIDTTIFGPTVSSYYWSSTTNAGSPDYAWVMNFGDGDVFNGVNVSNFYVRAVRGGL